MTIAPGSAALKRTLFDLRSVTDTLVANFIDSVRTHQVPPSAATTAEVTSITRTCLEITRGMIDGRQVTDAVDRLSIAAAELAYRGVSIEIILHGIREGIRLILDMTFARNATRDRETLVDGFLTAMTIADLMCASVTHAYISEPIEPTSQHMPEDTLTSALLSGRSTEAITCDHEITVADTYSVLALSIRQKSEDLPSARNTVGGPRHIWRSVHQALTQRIGARALSLLSERGGSLLIPTDLVTEDELGSLIEALGHAADAEVTAALTTASTADIPSAAEWAHETLDIVERLSYSPGLYRFADIALEYQLTRPGPGYERLGKLLSPLDVHPELRETLRVHVANNMNRRRSARILRIHTNTLDHRLRRVARLTGVDPMQPSGRWRLQSAMVVQDCRRSVSTSALPPCHTGRQ